MSQVLFIHGYSGHPDNWDNLRTALPENLKGRTVTLVGHGFRLAEPGPFNIERCADDILSALHHPAILVGHSMGCRIALEVARRVNDKVKALVLVDGSNAPGNTTELRQTLNFERKSRGHDEMMGDVLDTMMVGKLSAGLRTQMTGRIRSMPATRAGAYEISMMQWGTNNFKSALAAVKCPVLLVQSTSLVSGEGWTRKSISEQPNSLWLDAWEASGKAMIVRITGCGHYVMMEKPAVVAGHIVRFLQTRNDWNNP